MAGLKKFFLVVLLFVCANAGFGQADTGAKPETSRIQPAITPSEKPQLLKKRIADTSLNEYADSVLQKDSLVLAQKLRDSLFADSVQKAARVHPVGGAIDTSTYQKYQTHPYLPLHAEPVYMLIDYHESASKDELFYLMAGIVLVLAFIRAMFSKYFKNLFLLFFQTSLRQKQTRDQLLQAGLASLLSNLLFILSAALYITLLIRYKNWTDISFWWLALGSAAILLVVYLIKYLFLLFTGWVFNTKEAAGSYIFVVFLVNKVLGVLLVPFLLILSFGSAQLVEVAVTVSVGMILVLFSYRYWVSFVAIRNKLKVNALHFLLYLCAVELLPLVLIYKVLIDYFTGSF